MVGRDLLCGQRGAGNQGQREGLGVLVEAPGGGSVGEGGGESGGKGGGVSSVEDGGGGEHDGGSGNCSCGG